MEREGKILVAETQEKLNALVGASELSHDCVWLESSAGEFVALDSGLADGIDDLLKAGTGSKKYREGDRQTKVRMVADAALNILQERQKENQGQGRV